MAQNVVEPLHGVTLVKVIDNVCELSLDITDGAVVARSKVVVDTYKHLRVTVFLVDADAHAKMLLVFGSDQLDILEDCHLDLCIAERDFLSLTLSLFFSKERSWACGSKERQGTTRIQNTIKTTFESNKSNHHHQPKLLRDTLPRLPVSTNFLIVTQIFAEYPSVQYTHMLSLSHTHAHAHIHNIVKYFFRLSTFFSFITGETFLGVF